MNTLYFGDNLDVLRQYIDDESVDLIYLDPPFNSQARYNVLFESPAEDRASAQVEAFRDTWAWGEETEASYSQILAESGTSARFVSSLRSALGESDMMAYLVMMAARLRGLHRSLRPTGSLYLHCDPTASHYLKIILDGVFGPGQFKNEIIWKRTSAHSSAKRYGPVHDTILFYSKSSKYCWNRLYQDYDKEYLDNFYTHVDSDGRRWRRSDLTGAGIRHGETGQTWRGIDITAKGRHWAYPPTELERIDKQARIHWPQKKGGMPMLKRYLDEQPGAPLQDVWNDIPPMHNLSAERLGYPTQKPLELLKRLIAATSHPGDTILDPFCGCGTTIHAAQELGRKWIGIDVAYYAIRLIKRRLSDSLGYQVRDSQIQGLPRDLEQARALAERDKYQFQWWANSVVGVQQFREVKKGADRGIDGEYYFPNGPRPAGRVLTSVKGGKNVGVAMVRDFRGTIEREGADMGMFICLGKPTKNMTTEAASAGFVKTAHGQFPRIQIFSVQGFFEGQAPYLPPPIHVEENTFSTRRRRKTPPRPDPRQPQLPLPITGGGNREDKTRGITRHVNPDVVTSLKTA